MELNQINHDEVLKGLGGQLRNFKAPERLSSTPTQRRDVARNFEAPERYSSTLIERRGWNVDHGQATHELKQS